MLLRALPVQAPDQLVNLANPGPKPGSQTCNDQGSCDEVFSYAMFRDLQQAPQARAVFTGIAAHRTFGANLAYRGQTGWQGEPPNRQRSSALWAGLGSEKRAFR